VSEKSLVELRVGLSGRIVRLETHDETLLRKLTALGLAPGEELTLLQKIPSYIIKVGYTEVALDRETAVSIILSCD